MKNLLTFSLTFLISGILFAQAPEKISYQTVIRNAADELVAESTIGIQISILQGSAIGTAIYVETHTPITNINGLASLEIGDGTTITGIFSGIDWSNGPYFIKTEMDTDGGISYTITGTSQLLSVPYALYAGHAGDDGDWITIGDTVHTDKSVGIGTTSPTADLDVEGNFQLKDGSQADQKILTSDADGNASWQNLSTEIIFGNNFAPLQDISCLDSTATVPAGVGSHAVARSGNFAFLLNDGDDTMMVFDISDPASPVLSATVATGDIPNSISISGNYAYVANYNSNNMMVFDITDLEAPSMVSTIATGAFPYAVSTHGSYAYVVNWGTDNMMVFDVSVPASPMLVSTIATGDAPTSVATSDNYAYVANSVSNNMMVYDIGIPSAPVLSASIASTGIGPISLTVSGNSVFMLNQLSTDSAMTVYDITDPTVPFVIASVSASNPRSISISGDYAFIANTGDDNMMIYDIGDPSAPVELSSLATGIEPSGVSAVGNIVCVANRGGDNMSVFRPFCSTALTLDPVTGEFMTQTINTLGTQFWTETADSTNEIYYNGDKVGIGTDSPTQELDVNGKLRVRDVTLDNTTDSVLVVKGDGIIYFRDASTIGAGASALWNSSGGDIYNMTNGNVGIGTPDPQSKFTVNGKISCEDVTVTLAELPNIVFEPEYDLLTLQELEAYINEHGHLPNVPSTIEVEENGLGLGEMNKILLEKVEELTLHLIEKDKEIDRIEQENRIQMNKIKAIEQRLGY